MPRVLPMPVGAWASRQRPVLAALNTSSANARCPGRKSTWGKVSVASHASRHSRWAASCSAQAKKRWHWSAKNAASSSARASSVSRVSWPLAISRYTSASVMYESPRSAQSSAPYTFTWAQCSARWLSAMRARLLRWVLISSTQFAATSKPSARPTTRSP